MRQSLLLSAALLAGSALAAGAQGSIKLSDVAGTWHNKATVGPKDSTVVMSVTTATADKNGWTMKYEKRDALPVRIVAMGGDSIVTEVGPYPSMLRPGQTVTVLHTVGHYKGDKMTGTFQAHYSGGDTATGKVESSRSKM